MHVSCNLVGKANPMGMNLNLDFKSGFSKLNITYRGIGLMAIGDYSGNMFFGMGSNWYSSHESQKME